MPKYSVSWTDTVRVINYGYYTPGPGMFGLQTSTSIKGSDTVFNVGTWHSCRETFHKHNESHTTFYFCHRRPSPSRGRAISVFIDKIEKRLGLKKKDRTKMGPTSSRAVCWIEVSKWWRRSNIRRSLFTALLRAANDYSIEEDNFDKCLKEGKYIETTQDALNRFLDGNVYYWGSSKQWYIAFCNRGKKKDLKRLLQSSPKPPKPIVKKIVKRKPK